MLETAFTPPAPTPRYVPPGARPSLTGYLNYFQIMKRNPLEIWTEGHYREFVWTPRVFGQPYAITHDPAAIRHYLVTNAENYGLTRMRRALFEPLIGDGLLIAEGDLWKRTRKALTPVFNHRNVRGFAGVMRDVAANAAERLAGEDGATVPMSREMLTLALDVLTACLFSGDEAIDTARFSRNLDRLLHIAGMPHPLDLMGAPSWAPRLGRGDANRLVAELRDQVTGLLAARRAREEEAGTDDFLSLLMRAGADEGAPLSDTEIVDNLITFLAAGHETTARTLAWTFYLVSKSPDAFEQAVAEIDGAGLETEDPADWGGRLPFVTAVIKESMRLYPAAAIFTRLSKGPDRLGDIDIAAGTEVVTSPWVLHRHEKLWERPWVFDPDRFMGAAAEKIPRYAYMPFGAGPRICIGASFSMQEMVIIMAEFLARLRFEHVGAQEPQPIMRITVQPSTEVEMRVTRRVR